MLTLDKEIVESIQETNKALTNIAKQLDDDLIKPDCVESSLYYIYVTDIIRFVFYIAKSDGKITEEEVDAYNTLFECNVSYDEFVKRAIEEDFSYTKLPLSFLVLTDCLDEKKDFEYFKDFVKGLVSYYKYIGYAIANADNDFCEEEQIDLESFILLLTTYAKGLCCTEDFEI
ncbi:MAG: TerB family tellurite resistance protein [Coriobacteriales bacterium]|nr:TerB family tellurite resistance protein [Coriobacteriales bacterium]